MDNAGIKIAIIRRRPKFSQVYARTCTKQTRATNICEGLVYDVVIAVGHSARGIHLRIRTKAKIKIGIFPVGIRPEIPFTQIRTGQANSRIVVGCVVEGGTFIRLIGLYSCSVKTATCVPRPMKPFRPGLNLDPTDRAVLQRDYYRSFGLKSTSLVRRYWHRAER